MQAWTGLPGVLVGHAEDPGAATGCTVILVPEGATAGVDVRGGAPGTRETDLLRPTNTVDAVHAVVLCGGSAFGLDAASGVMRWLEEKGAGFDTGVARVPIVTGAVLFDLAVGRSDVRPTADMGYAACCAASPEECRQGCVGAGTGATVGKFAGMDRAVKSGIGFAFEQAGAVTVAAWVAVNAAGEVVDEDGTILAGARGGEPGMFVPSLDLLRAGAGRAKFGTNTTIGCIVTNVRLTKAQAQKVAEMAHAGMARAIRPVHTPVDGDTLFALSVGDVTADVLVVGSLAAEVVASAIRSAVRHAESLAGLPSAAAWRRAAPG